MSRIAAHAVPVAVLAAVVAADLLLDPDQGIVGLVVVAPVVAATLLGRRATAAHGVLAVATAALLGAVDGHLGGPALATLVVGVAVGSGAALAACVRHERREREVGRLEAERAAGRAVQHLSETLQRSLLTEPPQLAWLSTATRYRPATAGAHVGGDWYDAFAVPDGTTLLVIADVTGHDAVAAATMAQVRGVLRGLAQSVVGSPAAVLAALDRALDDLGVGTLVSMVVASLDPRPAGGARLSWTNAGHPPPALVGAGGDVVLLDRPVDPPLGLLPGRARVDHELLLAPGDTLVLYTDGLVESRTAARDAGLVVLVDSLRGAADRSPDEVCDGVLTRLGRRAEDDVALLVARIR
ncbi:MULTISPECIES: PP2C family protein-serine/threonine phosphatase [unclassified Blastococcus]